MGYNKGVRGEPRGGPYLSVENAAAYSKGWEAGVVRRPTTRLVQGELFGDPEESVERLKETAKKRLKRYGNYITAEYYSFGPITNI